MTDILTPEAEIRRICHEWRGEHRIATTLSVRWLLAQWLRSRRQLAAERQARAALEQALQALHDAVVRHGVVQGDGPEWLAAFTGLMDATKAARALLHGAGEVTGGGAHPGDQHAPAARLDLEIAKLKHIIEIERRNYDRLNLCPDHRDKSGDYCIVCRAETRTREELRASPGAGEGKP